MIFYRTGCLPVFRRIALPVICLFGFPGAQMVSVPAGSFQMGNDNGDCDEKPVHTVSLSSFSLQCREVTEAAYEACVRAGRCSPAHYDDSTCNAWNGRRFVKVRVPAAVRGEDYPVVCVTWQQARQYCRANGMDLPTEAQWEYAARAGTVQTAATAATERKEGPVAAGSGVPNGLGLYDMLGNVWEWVNDYYDPAAYEFSDENDPEGPDAGFYRVIRGGGWYSVRSRISVSDRQWFSPAYSEVSIGFRCVKK